MSTWIARELDKVLRDLTPLKNRRRVTKLQKSAAGMDKINGLIEDIRAAMVDYRVRPWNSDIYHP